MAAYIFSKKDDRDYANCSGIYRQAADKPLLNGQPVFINQEKQRLVGYTGSGWMLTELRTLDNLVEGQLTNFGGFHACAGPFMDDASWNEYIVTQLVTLEVTCKPNLEDTADCAGTYVAGPKRAEGREVYICEDKGRFLAKKGDVWVIDNLECLEVCISGKADGTLHTSSSAEHPESAEWEAVEVKCEWRRPEVDSEAHKWAKDRKGWKVFENMKPKTLLAVNCAHAMQVAENPRDFYLAARKCIELDCAGFGFTPRHFDQYGDEDSPSLIVFYNNRQEDLEADLAPAEGQTFFLAPEGYVPDLTFKPRYAPALYIWWHTNGPVHGFACQVRVPNPTARTFYMAGGFDGGYCGIQQHDGEHQRILFSLWNHGQGTTPASTECVAPGCKGGSFSGEGKGVGVVCAIGHGNPEEETRLAKFLPGEKVTFVLRTYPQEGGMVKYVCMVHKAQSGSHETEEPGWVHFATHVRHEGENSHGKLSNIYSFIESIGVTPFHRRATWGPAFYQKEEGDAWTAITSVSGQSQVAAGTPNVRLSLIGTGELEMATGGEAFEEGCDIFSGEIGDSAEMILEALDSLPATA